MCQNGGLSVSSSNGEKKEVGWVGDDSHVVFGQKNPRWKWKSETVRCRDAIASYFVTKDRAKSSHIFRHSLV
jgi:hypothetical protein